MTTPKVAVLSRNPAKFRQSSRFYGALDQRKRQDALDNWWLNEYKKMGRWRDFEDMKQIVEQKRRLRRLDRDEHLTEEAARQVAKANQKRQLKNEAVEAKRVSALNQKEWRKRAEVAAKRGGGWQRDEIRVLRGELLNRKLPSPHHPTTTWENQYVSARVALRRRREMGNNRSSSNYQRPQREVQRSSRRGEFRDFGRNQGKREEKKRYNRQGRHQK